jgi:tRNA(fMet)-specific endonuclease VapC
VGLLIDTSVFVAIERSGAVPSDALESLGDRPVHLAAITASELLHGVHRAESAVRRQRRQDFVESVLEVIPVLPFDLDTARVHSRLWADLARTGSMIGSHDLQIAATAIARDLELVTANAREFGRVEGVVLHSW